MKRRSFLGNIALTSALTNIEGLDQKSRPSLHKNKPQETLKADLIIAGGGLGGCAASLAALRNGLTVILTEETDWLGGQISQQGVPPDEHQWIETHGAPKSYRDFRNAIREYYIKHYPLTDEAKSRKYLNPGDGSVSRICCEPRVAVAVLNEMLAPYLSSGRLTLLTEHKSVSAEVQGNRVKSLDVVSTRTGRRVTLSAPYFADATELGDLLPMTGTEFVTGTESKAETGELHAPEKGNPDNVQAFTMCFAIDYRPGENHVIEKPVEYDFWRNHVPKMSKPWSGRLLDLAYSNPKTLEPKTLGFHPEGIKTGDALNLWLYRRIISRQNFTPGTYAGDITIVNWPQNDYVLGNLIGASEKDSRKHIDRAKQLSLSLLYWLQTEAPRPDGGKGWPGIRLRKDIMGTDDGLAKYPYVRESRRIKALFTIKEEHVGAANREMAVANGAPGDKTKAATFPDSVGIGYYHIDLHPSSAGDNYIDFASLPFQIPLGSLLPIRMENLLPANKNIGTTHITNGCYRLHPVEWSIGEAVGLLVKFALDKKVVPRKVREEKGLLEGFQGFLVGEGVELAWKG
ncbi:FAD-dependent oxidoreductase [Dyadobacter sandarakinus]|uniref:FAD-dependent oxidoreductase n=1 Tax=Dyadobacter sandarakinus TaxID=2747268 RepID=A0ABX7I9U7_9BACT|nr:FAD-dependent oxidoreductase [Dyadobacter sandarakinus]QRR02202.1 FAD-dependent oxidoreductase [Dyadobacter sandarakinus]